MKTFIAVLETDPENDELVLPLSQEFLDEHNWLIGDKLDMHVDEDGAIHITNLSWLDRFGNEG